MDALGVLLTKCIKTLKERCWLMCDELESSGRYLSIRLILPWCTWDTAYLLLKFEVRSRFFRVNFDDPGQFLGAVYVE